VWDLIKTLPLYFLPQHFLSRCMYRVTRWRWRPWKSAVIQLFIRCYRVDMDVAEPGRPEKYTHFNAFFTRSLRPGARPIDDSADSITSPVDGNIFRYGEISNDRIIQAKKRDFSLRALLCGDTGAAEKFDNGSFATIYLAPRDYHRIHMPVDGRLLQMTYIPGDLFSVNGASSRTVNNLLARNERLVCLFESDFGLMGLVLVGAIFVGGLETVWHGEVTPAGRRQLRTWKYGEAGGRYAKGEEMGRFNMGSTVVLLFEPRQIGWSADLREDAAVIMGQPIGAAAARHVTG